MKPFRDYRQDSLTVNVVYLQHKVSPVPGWLNISGYKQKAFKELSVLLEYTFMNLNDQELKTIWLNAYNAALTGLLACRTDEVTASSQSVKIIGEICTEFADRAVKDAKEH